ncbi:MAG TPA: MBL fold metallo-hydrolase, partial [Magnetospirillaceae bacterium]|nr:MBL fold metallo-hydrolase [Magnetospirillaceae bacterium]
ANPQDLQAVFLTHAHFDHSGMLPLLVKRGFQGNIYATPATRDLTSIIMMDSARIQARDAQYLAKQAAKRGETFTWKPLYDETDAVKAAGQFVTASYGRPLQAGDGVRIELFDAGHILGSAIVHATVRDSRGRETTIAFTGDLGRKGKPIIRDPDRIPPAEWLVLEATYGNRLHESQDDALDLLARIVRETAGKGGKIVIPAFAIERTQELVYLLHILTDRKAIPDIPIWVDSPMAINATTIFQVHPECYDKETYESFLRHHKNPFGFNNLRFSSTVDESKALNDLKGPAIIISADGMCEAGRIQHHLLHTIEDPNNTVLIVGYMARDTLGRRIRDRHPEVRIHGNTLKLRARVESINAFSAHADYRETWEWLCGLDLDRLRGVFLVHGEDEGLAAMAAYLGRQGLKDVRIMRYGEKHVIA